MHIYIYIHMYPYSIFKSILSPDTFFYVHLPMGQFSLTFPLCAEDAAEAWKELRSSMAEAAEGDLKAQALLHWMKLEAFLGGLEGWEIPRSRLERDLFMFFFAGTGRCPTGFMEFQISPEDLI